MFECAGEFHASMFMTGAGGQRCVREWRGGGSELGDEEKGLMGFVSQFMQTLVTPPHLILPASFTVSHFRAQWTQSLAHCTKETVVSHSVILLGAVILLFNFRVHENMCGFASSWDFFLIDCFSFLFLFLPTLRISHRSL